MTLADVKMCSDCHHCGAPPSCNINICGKRPDVRLRLAREACGGREWEERPRYVPEPDCPRPDILTRLRDRADSLICSNDTVLLRDAADEIERLRTAAPLPEFLARQGK